MRNIVYDFFGADLCFACILTMIGILVLPDVLEIWSHGRK